MSNENEAAANRQTAPSVFFQLSFPISSDTLNLITLDSWFNTISTDSRRFPPIHLRFRCSRPYIKL